ncbi:hypothetical protein [Actinoplanes sp. NPDC051494]|uniref:hypothetical protein n=1 Tax=Actinoplanes sp. NPDC051494 TaxID=3363907 RepID=UPI00379427A9
MTAGDQTPRPRGQEPWGQPSLGQPSPAGGPPRLSRPIGDGQSWEQAPAAPPGLPPASPPVSDEAPATAPARAEAVLLKGWPWMTGGMLALVIGGLWTAQGLDLVHDSIMSGVTAFALIGPVVAIAGLALIVMGVRSRGRYKRDLAA